MYISTKINKVFFKNNFFIIIQAKYHFTCFKIQQIKLSLYNLILTWFTFSPPQSPLPFSCPGFSKLSPIKVRTCVILSKSFLA